LKTGGWVHFIASDAHDAVHRTTVLSDAYRHVAKVWGEATAETLFVTAPRAAVEGEPIDPVTWNRCGRSGSGTGCGFDSAS